MTMEGEVMGTPQYMSPEQAEGVVAGLDERSDVYALGAILYAVLTYKPPIDGRTLDEVLGNVKRGSLSPMATATRMTKGIGGRPEPMPVEVPEALRAVVRKAMALHREHRYASVEELGVDVDAYVGGFATRAEGAGLFRQVKLFVRRHRTVSAAVVLFLMSLAGFLVKLAASERAARLYARTAEEQREIAERQAEVAQANEKAAKEQTESARRSAARAQIALAEASESLEDGSGVVAALSSLDEDLKMQPSRYLESRMDESILTHRFDKPAQQVLAHPKNGNQFVIVQTNGLVRSLDVLSGEVSDLFKIGIHGPNHCAFSRDGKQFAWLEGSSAGMSLNVWSVAAGEQSLKVPDAISSSNIFGIAFSPDGKRVLVNASAPKNREGGRLRVWDSATGEVVWSREKTGHLHAEYSADGSRVCVLSERDGMLELDAATGEVERVVNASFRDTVGALLASSWAVVERTDARLGYRSRKDGALWHQERLPEAIRQVVSLGKDGIVAVPTRRWDNSLMIRMAAENGEGRDPLFYVGKLYDNRRLIAQPLSGYLALRNGDELKVWRLRGSDALNRVPANWDRQNRAESYLRFQKFSGNQLFRARSHPEGFLMELFDAKDPFGERAPVARLAAPQVSSYGSLSGVPGLAVWKGSGAKPTMSVFEITRSGIKLLRDNAVPFELLDCLISPDGRHVFGGHGILEARTGKEVVRMDRTNVGGHYKSFWAPRHRIVELVHLGLDGEGGGEESSAKGLILWNGDDGRRLAAVSARYATSMAISPDGRRFLEGGSDGKVRIRSVDTLEVEKEFRVENGPVVRVAWHPTLPLFVTKSDARGRVWDMSGVKQWESGRDVARGEIMFTGDGKTLMFYSATEVTTYAPEPFSSMKKK
jgi:WD40 repeat protein